jgi:leucine dehydrogenase
MTYKSAVAGLPLGGGKSVVIGDPARRDREACFRAHGRYVDTLGGRYITAADVGTSSSDMEIIHLETEYVAGLPGQSGDPSPVTGYGVFMAMKAARSARKDTLAGRRAAVQGAGKVAQHLARHLHEEGAKKLIVTDIRKAAFVSRLHATAVAPTPL